MPQSGNMPRRPSAYSLVVLAFCILYEWNMTCCQMLPIAGYITYAMSRRHEPRTGQGI